MNLAPAKTDSQTSRRYRNFYFALAFVVMALDQASKALVMRKLPLHDQVTVIPGFFSISHVLNRGAAFSMFADHNSDTASHLLIAFAVIVIAGISYFLFKSTVGLERQGIAFALVLGGALGNVIDRITIGAVVDFLAFRIGSYHWPDFNLADSAIVCGVLLIALDLFLTRNDSKPTQQ